MAQSYEVVGIRHDGEFDHCIAFDSMADAAAHFDRERERSGYSSLTLCICGGGEREQVRSCTWYG